MSVLIGTELNSSLRYLFDRRNCTAILATIDKDNHPHTAPYNGIVACDPKHLRIAICKDHKSYTNIVQSAHVALAVLEEGDVAVCIKGIALVVRNYMDFDCNMAIIEIEINEIRKNNSTNFLVTQGIRTKYRNERSLLDFRKLISELNKCDGLPHS
jgi:hypothetical protein